MIVILTHDYVTLNGRVDLKQGRLSCETLKAENSLQLVSEEEGQGKSDSKHRTDLMHLCWLEDAGGDVK